MVFGSCTVTQVFSSNYEKLSLGFQNILNSKKFLLINEMSNLIFQNCKMVVCVLKLFVQKCKIVVCGLAVYKCDSCPKMAKKIDINFKKRIGCDVEIDRPRGKNFVLKKLVSLIEVQPKKRTRSFGSKTCFNPSKGHSNLGQISSHRGYSKVKKRDITSITYK